MKKKNERIISIVLIFMLLFSLPLKTTAKETYTTDDLRELMGMCRLTELTSKLEIKHLLSKCYKQKQWNQLVENLKNVKDIELDKFKKIEDTWYEKKDKLFNDFTANEPVDVILSDYTEYKTAQSLRIPYIESKGVDLKLYDMEAVEADLAYAYSILDAVGDKTVVGVIGHKMKSFTKNKLMVLIPFGKSKSYTTNKLVDHDGLTISIQKKHKIYSQFNGKVTKVTNSSVTIKTGKSIEIEYLDIKPCVKMNQPVKQYDKIGKAIKEYMMVRFRLNTIHIDPLLLYGTRGKAWYDSWNLLNPGCLVEQKDYSHLLDTLPNEVKDIKKNSKIVGKVADEAGVRTPIKIQGNNYYKDTPDDIMLEKTTPSVITN